MSFIPSFAAPVVIFLYYAGRTFIYWFPFVGAYLCWTLYVRYIQAKWLSQTDYALLEIQIPKLISKSPAVMEMIIGALHQPSSGSLIDRFIKGRVVSVSSLELASFNGSLHFFIRVERKLRNLLESVVYSQYPEVEIREVEDYVHQINYGLPNSGYEIYGEEFTFTKPDPYPLKTYIDYGMDKDPKEEFKVDPMTPLLEFFGSMGPGEQLWLQILIKAAPKEWLKHGEEEIKKITESAGSTRIVGGEEQTMSGLLNLTPGKRKVIEAIERSYGKYAFQTGIRCLYLAKNEVYNGTNVPRMFSMFKQFDDQNLNSLKFIRHTGFDYPWEDWRGLRTKYVKWKMFDYFRRRSYFYPPAHRTPIVLNTEELATIYHFPGQVATTPTLERIGSKRGEPPANLPV